MCRKKKTEYVKCCALCEKGTLLDTGDVLCSKKGVCSADAVCRGFRFDLMKHEPKRRPALPDFTPVNLDD